MESRRVVEKAARTSADVTEELIERLRNAIPEYFLDGELDVERLKAMLGEIDDGKAERYSFSWAGKQDAIRILQTPTSATLAPVPEESIEWETTRNIFIEGDNLEVLKLLYKAYFGKVKMIYIDPPYNTGNDFVYPDNYADPLDTYLQMTGQKDVEGNILSSNTDASGRFHSAWLTMMYPRLFLARQLLRDDGILVVSIDDTEVHNLRMIMNEIFGDENFIANLVWQRKYGPANDAKQISQTHEHLLIFARNGTDWRPNLLPRSEKQLAAFKNPDNDPRGPWRASDLSARTASESTYYPIVIPATGEKVYPPASRSWIVSEAGYKELLEDNRIWFGSKGTTRPMVKKFLSEVKQGITPQTWWNRDFAGDNKIARYEIKKLFPNNVFDTPKPVKLLERLLQIGTDAHSDDIVMDFFAGSCTTADAVLSANRLDDGNRSFIMVQLPEPTPKALRARSPEFETIADIGKERIQRTVGRLEQADAGKLPLQNISQDHGLRIFELHQSNIKDWQGTSDADAELYVGQMELFTDTLIDGWKVDDLVWEIAIKEGFPLASLMERVAAGRQEVIKVSEPESGQYFYVYLDDKVNAKLAVTLKLNEDDLLVCRDSALDDTTAANLALQCRLKTF
jgi:adenine-specific DNA-methyltransferase